MSTDTKERVLQVFAQASAEYQDDKLYRILGIPGMSFIGLTEELAWASALPHAMYCLAIKDVPPVPSAGDDSVEVLTNSQNDERDGRARDVKAPDQIDRGFPTEILKQPMRRMSFEKLFSHLLHLETKDVTLKWIFDVVRNFIITGVLCLVGIKGFKIENYTYIDAVMNAAGGVFLIALSIFLFVFNFIHIVVGFSKVRSLSAIGMITYFLIFMLIFFAGNLLFITAKQL